MAKVNNDRTTRYPKVGWYKPKNPRFRRGISVNLISCNKRTDEAKFTMAGVTCYESLEQFCKNYEYTGK